MSFVGTTPKSRSKRILVLCPFPYGVAAAQRLKFEQYYDDWRAQGWDVVVAPFMDLAMWRVLFERGHWAAKAAGLSQGYARRLTDLFRIRSADIVYCHMYATPLGSSLAERIVRRLARRLIYDIEDNVALQPQKVANPNALVRLLRGTGKFRFLIREADHVIASSPELAGQCRDLNRRHKATYITSSLDSDRFVPRSERKKGPIVIGWTGTFSSRPYLDLIAPVLRQLAVQRDFRLRIIGNFDYALEGVDLEVLRWSESQEVAQLQGIDIGLYPLPADDWVSGKSGLKAITYMMMGIPCVASDVGTTPLIVVDGETGFLARSDEDWLKILRNLIDDSALRERIGRRARAEAVEKYSRKAVAARYRAVLDEVMQG